MLRCYTAATRAAFVRKGFLYEIPALKPSFKTFPQIVVIVIYIVLYTNSIVLSRPTISVVHYFITAEFVKGRGGKKGYCTTCACVKKK